MVLLVFVFSFFSLVFSGQPSSFVPDGWAASGGKSDERSVAPAWERFCSPSPSLAWSRDSGEVTSVTQGSKIPKRQMPGGALAWVDLLEIMILLTVLSRAVSSLESQPLSTKAVKTGRKEVHQPSRSEKKVQPPGEATPPRELTVPLQDDC